MRQTCRSFVNRRSGNERNVIFQSQKIGDRLAMNGEKDKSRVGRRMARVKPRIKRVGVRRPLSTPRC